MLVFILRRSAKKMAEEIIRRVNGKTVINRKVIGKANCQNLFRIFSDALRKTTLDWDEFAMLLLNAKDFNGISLMGYLLSDGSWHPIMRQDPYRLAPVFREKVLKFLDAFDEKTAEKLRSIEGQALIIVDFGVAEVFEA
jgi:hypothetical protein